MSRTLCLALLLVIMQHSPCIAQTDGWTDELLKLNRMSIASRDYSLRIEDGGVGIVFHIGKDILHRSDAQDAYGKVASHLIRKFGEHGTNARVFPVPNPGGTVTVISFHAAGRMFNVDQEDGKPDVLFNLKEGILIIPQVAESHKLGAEIRNLPNFFAPDRN